MFRKESIFLAMIDPSEADRWELVIKFQSLLGSDLQTKKGDAGASPCFDNPRRRISELTLGELEALASARLTGLFALFHARVTGEKAFSLQRTTETCVDLE